MKTLFRILTTPLCWSRNGSTNEYVSNFINKSLDEGHKPIMIDSYTHRLNNKCIWTSNYPYAFGNIFNDPTKSLPDRRTAFRLYDATIKEMTK